MKHISKILASNIHLSFVNETIKHLIAKNEIDEKQKKKYLWKSNYQVLKVKEDHKGNGQDYN